MEKQNCWNCSYHRNGGHTTLLGNCWWFVAKLGFARIIPKTKVDVGCKCWTSETMDFIELEKLVTKEPQL